MSTTTAAPLTAKDYASDQQVRWCPGCGDYAILKAIQKTLAELEARPENTVFISGIGCAARFPYYMETYGFHTIHGRAPAIATGVKLANPDLDVWVMTGDGDSLSIGGNHLLHVLRRNVDLQIILFNNEIYGLTKGQASPTSRTGTLTPSTPRGSVDTPVNPAAFALGSGARFLARAIDIDQKNLVDVLRRAHEHRGASLVEIFQNCIVFNDAVFAEFTDRKSASDTQLHVQHGEPLRFGPDRMRGLRLDPVALRLEVVDLSEEPEAEAQVLIHDERNRMLAHLLAELRPPEFPMPLGVLYCDPAPAPYESEVLAQAHPNGRSLADMVRSDRTWTVTG